MTFLKIGRWRLVLNSLALVAVVGATAFFLGGATYEEGAGFAYLPALTMVYEMDGPSVNGALVRETRRLEYRSRTDWTDTVIESTSVDVRTGDFAGVFNSAGSYTRLKGARLTEYDVFTGHSREETLEPNTTFLPNGALRPHHLDLLAATEGIELTPVATRASVCYREDCRENVTGLLLARRGWERVFLDDPRWDIPLRIGDSSFVARELRVEASRP